MSVASLAQALRPVVRQALISGGTAVGASTGIPYASQIGGYLGAQLSKFIGSGDYVANSLLKGSGPPQSMSPARFKKLSFGQTRIQHTEFITEVVAPSANFNLISYQVNPGNPLTFPGASNIAVAYEEYYIESMAVVYVPTASMYGNGNNALGKVMIAAEYNVNSPNFTSSRAMENSNECIVFRPCDNAAYGIECADFPYEKYFVRRAGVNVPDAALYDALNINVATYTPITGVPLGELRLVYSIVLGRPHIPDTSGEVSYTHLICPNAQTGWAAGYYPLYSARSYRLYNAYVPAAPAANVLEYHLTNYNQFDIVLVAVTISGDSAAASAPFVLNVGSGGTLLMGFDESTQGRMALPNAASAAANTNVGAVMTAQITGDPTSSDFVFTLTGTNGAPGTVSDFDVYICKLMNPGGVWSASL